MNNIGQRIRSVIMGIGMLICGFVILWKEMNGYAVVLSIYSLAMIFTGIRILIYFIMIARFMVGGRIMLYLGVICFDFGVFMFSLTDVPKGYILMFLLICHLFAGLIDILRAHEAKRLEAPSWKLNFIFGVINIAMAILCVIFIRIRETDAVIYVFSAGLFYSALIKIISAFRKTAVVYIQ